MITSYYRSQISLYGSHARFQSRSTSNFNKCHHLANEGLVNNTGATGIKLDRLHCVPDDCPLLHEPQCIPRLLVQVFRYLTNASSSSVDSTYQQLHLTIIKYLTSI